MLPRLVSPAKGTWGRPALLVETEEPSGALPVLDAAVAKIGAPGRVVVASGVALGPGTVVGGVLGNGSNGSILLGSGLDLFFVFRLSCPLATMLAPDTVRNGHKKVGLTIYKIK